MMNFSHQSVTKPSFLLQFNNELLSVLFENTYAFQLTDKCSIGCPWCGFDAEILKKNDQMNFITHDEMCWIFKNYSKVLAKSRPMLHWASEPSCMSLWVIGLLSLMFALLVAILIAFLCVLISVNWEWAGKLSKK